MEPISAFLEVVDRVIQLLKQQKFRKDEFFDQIIKPLYEGLPSAVDNIFSFLSEAEKLVNSRRYDDEAVLHLRQQRQEFLTSRIQVRSTANEIAKRSDDAAYKQFADQVARLFSATEPNMQEDDAYLNSMSAGILDILDHEISRQARAAWNEPQTAPPGSRFISTQRPDFDESILLSIALSRKRLESRWQKVSESYAGLLQDRYS
jgi:hypothetical protein